MRRDGVVQRWAGLAILFGTWFYVVLLSLVRLQGLVRIGALIGLAAVFLIVAWFARTNRLGEAPDPADPLDLTPSVPRERPHGRR